jgi:hypothetical protein
MANRPFHEGLIRGRTGGRTDTVLVSVLDGSYIVPADCVAGLGDSNTLSGESRLSTMFMIAGDLPADAVVVDVKVAAGEYIVRPDRLVVRFRCVLAEALDRMDAWIVEQRRAHIKALTKLPAPKHSKITAAETMAVGRGLHSHPTLGEVDAKDIRRQDLRYQGALITAIENGLERPPATAISTVACTSKPVFVDGGAPESRGNGGTSGSDRERRSALWAGAEDDDDSGD